MHHHYKRSIYKISFRNEFKVLSERYDSEEKDYRTWFFVGQSPGEKSYFGSVILNMVTYKKLL